MITTADQCGQNTGYSRSTFVGMGWDGKRRKGYKKLATKSWLHKEASCVHKHLSRFLDFQVQQRVLCNGDFNKTTQS